MARVVCQVLHRPNRISVLWSEGAAAFEPYHLDASAAETLYATARQARECLATALAFRDAADELATLGDQLYRSLFQLDDASPAAQAVQRWWQELQANNAVTSLEIQSDRPGSIPWSLVFDPAERGAGSSGERGNLEQPGSRLLQHFWGNRFALGVGRRVNPHRVFPYLDKPDLLVALDPACADQLPGDVRQQFEQLVTFAGGTIVDSFDALTERLRRQAPDVLAIVSRVEHGQIVVGQRAGDVRALRRALAETEMGNPQPVVLLLGSALGDTQDSRSQSDNATPTNSAASWECFLAAATSELSSVLAPEVPGHAIANVRFGTTWLRAFLSAGTDLGTALRQARQELGLAGLAFSAFCPPYVCVLAGGKEPDHDLPVPAQYELPAQPYRGLKPFDREDRALFTGREDDTVRFARLLDEAGTRGVLLHGPAGVGKASLLRAGVLPYLEDEAVGYHTLRDRGDRTQTQAERDYPTLALRAGADLGGQLAEGLCAFCAQPFTYGTPAGGTVTVDLPAILERHLHGPATPPSEAIQAGAPLASGTGIVAAAPATANAAKAQSSLAVRLAQTLTDDPAVLNRLLEDISARLPFELVIVIEQLEDLVEANRGAPARRMAGLMLLAQLSSSQARCKFILSMRGEALGDITEGFGSGNSRPAWREFHLTPLTPKALLEALQLPAATAPPPYGVVAPHQQFRVTFAPGVLDVIVKDAVTLASELETGSAAIAQAACAFLVERARQRKGAQISLDDLRELRSVNKRGKPSGLALAPVREVRILLALRESLRGGKESAIDLTLDKVVEQQVQRSSIAPSARRALRSLLACLYYRREDGALMRPLVQSRDLVPHWKSGASLEAAVNAAAAPEAGLLEVQRLLVDGRSALYVGLASDALAGWAARQDELAQRRKFARSRVIDAMFIVVPLAILAIAITFYLLRGAVREQSELVERFQEHLKKDVGPKLERLTLESHHVPGPLYRGALAQADQVLRAGNILRARQLLLSQQPYAFLKDAEDDFDRRGFEWRYLWRQCNAERHTLVGHRGQVNAVATSPDNALVATGGADGKVMLWNLKRQSEVAAVYTAHRGPVLTVAFAPDGKTLASGDADSRIHIWNVQVGVDQPVKSDAPAKTLAGAAGPIHALAFGNDANTLVSGGGDHSAIVWDVAAAKPKITMKEHAEAVAALAVAADGKTIASGSKDKTVIVWDADTGKRFASIATPGSITGLAFVGDGMVASAMNEVRGGVEAGAVRLWDAKSGKEAAPALDVGGGVFAIAGKPKSSIVVVAGKDHSVRAWDSKSGQESAAWHGHAGWVNAVAVTPNGAALITASHDNTVKVWDWAAPVDTLRHGEAVQAVALSNDDQWLASGGRDGVVKIWRIASGEMVGEVKGHPGPVTALAFVPGIKEHKLAVGSWSADGAGSVKLWDIVIALGKAVAKEGPTFSGHTQGAHCLAVSKKGVLATGGGDGMVILWDCASGQKKQVLPGKQPVLCIAFSPSGNRLAAGDHDGDVQVWDAVGGEWQKRGIVGQAHRGGVRALLFRAEDFDFVTAGADQTIKQWDWKTKEKPTAGMIARAHSQPVDALVQLSDTTFATGSGDRTIKTWDLRDSGAGEERFTFVGHSGSVRALAASANRQLLISASNDGTIRLWRAAPIAIHGKK